MDFKQSPRLFYANNTQKKHYSLMVLFQEYFFPRKRELKDEEEATNLSCNQRLILNFN
jgi:hypothetical protein